MTPLFLTIDTEFAWRHHVAGLSAEEIGARSFEPGGVGLAWQLALLARHRLKATCFVDPLPALVHGLAPIRRVVEQVLAAGQEVQLHLHPQWTGARDDDRRAAGRFQLWEYDEAGQADLIGGAAELLVAAGAPQPIAFRAGSYAADDATLAALARLGFAYDSSHNGAQTRVSRIELSARQIAPVARGVVEVPVTVIEDRPGHLRPFQPCALSSAETAAALGHAAAAGHAAVTIVSHSFELANRAGTHANTVHVRRFEALCALLDREADLLPTTWFADRPALALDRDDQPLRPDRLRTGWRQAEQLWSNLVAERAA